MNSIIDDMLAIKQRADEIMADGNTAALNRHEIDEAKKDAAREQYQKDWDKRYHEILDLMESQAGEYLDQMSEEDKDDLLIDIHVILADDKEEKDKRIQDEVDKRKQWIATSMTNKEML